MVLKIRHFKRFIKYSKILILYHPSLYISLNITLLFWCFYAIIVCRIISFVLYGDIIMQEFRISMNTIFIARPTRGQLTSKLYKTRVSLHKTAASIENVIQWIFKIFEGT